MREIKLKALKIEKDRNGLDQDQLAGIKRYLEMSREEHESIRQFSGMFELSGRGRIIT
jgi:hypothetical protein